MTTELRNQFGWNVIEENDFKSSVRQVFKQVAQAVSRSAGPYGANTIIEQFGEQHPTKDGWQILKQIRFDNNMHNSIQRMLFNIAAQVVNKVGDGSTTSIIAADKIMDILDGNDELKKIRSKDLQDILFKVSQQISDRIMQAATPISIDEDPDFDRIYKLALVSTNGDKSFASFIQQIYKATNVPSIDFIKSKTNESKVELVSGYQGPISLLDDLFITNEENGTCEISRPWIVQFDHQFTYSVHMPIIQGIVGSIPAHTRLVVCAAHYDKHSLEHFRTHLNNEMRARGTTSVVYTSATLINNKTFDIYNDFAVMTGGRTISENDVREILHHQEQLLDETVKDTDIVEVDISQFIGQVDQIRISAKGSYDTFISGFFNRNAKMYEVTMNDAVSKFKKAQDLNSSMSIVTPEIFELKRRVYKLTGMVGLIHVGGSSSMEKTANMDIVEDAVKASESAFYYGYNPGGTLAIRLAINDILAEKRLEAASVDYTERERQELEVMRLLAQAFTEVFKVVLKNRDEDISVAASSEILLGMEENRQCYDLLTSTYNPDIINPAHTDTEILKAATSIVGLILTSNQYLTIKIGGEYN